VVISSVVPQVVYNLRVLSDRYFHCRPKVVGKPEVRLGVPVRVDPTAHVGADRLVNTVGAYDRYGGNLIVVDFGTATTFDVVDYSGAYKGGIIAPGINLSLDALVAAAAKLPRVAIEAPESASVIGRTTEEQMHIGIYWGYVAMMEGLVARLKAEIGRPVQVVATGGLAALFDERTDIFDKVEGDLTIQGLAMLFARSQGAA
jgi:type III pantothenate kinase